MRLHPAPKRPKKENQLRGPDRARHSAVRLMYVYTSLLDAVDGTAAAPLAGHAIRGITFVCLSFRPSKRIIKSFEHEVDIYGLAGYAFDQAEQGML